MSVRDGFDLNCGVKRATALPAWDTSPAAVASITYHDHPEYPVIKTFHCARLASDLSISACASNYRKGNSGPLACRACAIGSIHAGEAPGVAPKINSSDDAFKQKQAALEASRGFACVRCERTSATAPRFVGQMRLVRGHSLCISCVNREYEFTKRCNSKGAVPRIRLYPAVVVIKHRGKNPQTIEIGLRSGRPEIERYVARIYPDAKLLEVEIDGELVLAPTNVVNVPAITVSQVKTSRKRAARRKPLPVAPDAEAFEAEPATQRASSNGRSWLPPLSPEEALAYEQSFDREDEPAIVWPFPVSIDTTPAVQPVIAPVVEPLELAEEDPAVAPRVIPGSHARNLQDVHHEPGDRFGSLIAIDPEKSTYWRYRCDCGNETVKPCGRVKRGVITNCGYHCAAEKLIEDFFPIKTLIAFMCDRLGVPSALVVAARVADLIPKPVTPPSVTPVRLFSRELAAMGFKPKTLYGTLMPLAPDVGGRILVGCSCGHTFIEHHKRVLRGMDCPECHSIRKPESTFAQYLTDLHDVRGRIARAVVGRTAERALAVGVRAYHRSLKRNPQ